MGPPLRERAVSTALRAVRRWCLLGAGIAAACSNAGAPTQAARIDHRPILVRVAEADQDAFEGAVRTISEIWGIQFLPDGYAVIHAPRPLRPATGALLRRYEHWLDPAGERAPGESAHAVFAALWRPAPAPAPNPRPFQPAHDTFALAAEHGPAALAPQSYSDLNYGLRPSAFLQGSVAINLLLPQNTGVTDPVEAVWTADDVQHVVNQVATGLAYLQAQCRACNLTFKTRLHSNPPAGAPTGTVATDYEAIRYAFNDSQVNVNILGKLGYPTDNQFSGFFSLNNFSRLAANLDTDWAVTVKIGRDRAAYGSETWGGTGLVGAAYLHGPFFALTFENGARGRDALWITFLHELNHAFGALDEYVPPAWIGDPPAPARLAGYFKVVNAGAAYNDGNGYFGGAGEADAGCIMGNAITSTRYCAHTQGQIGWWSDLGGAPSLDLQLACTDKIAGSGQAMIHLNPLYSGFPYEWTPPHRVGLGAIDRIEFRVNGLTWLPAIAADGGFNAGKEAYTFAAAVPDGTYAVEARAVDTEGTTTWRTARATCTVAGSPYSVAIPFPGIDAPARAETGKTVVVNARASRDLDAPPHALEFSWDLGTGVFGAYAAAPTTAAKFDAPGTRQIRLRVRNPDGAVAEIGRALEIVTAGTLAPRIRVTAERAFLAGTTAPTFNLAVDSRDPYAGPLTVRWDFDGGAFDTPWLAAPATQVSFALASGASAAWQVTAEARNADGVTAAAYINLRAVAYDQPPTASASAEQLGPRWYRFDSSASGDPDLAATWDGLLERRWDFEGDGTFDTPYTTATTVEHTFDRNVRFTPTLEVRDAFRAAGRATLDLDLRRAALVGLAVDFESSPPNPIVSWQAAAQALAYEVELAADGAFATVLYSFRTPSASQPLPTLAPGQTYHWRVSALDEHYDASRPATASFTVPVPPADDPLPDDEPQADPDPVPEVPGEEPATGERAAPRAGGGCGCRSGGGDITPLMALAALLAARRSRMKAPRINTGLMVFMLAAASLPACARPAGNETPAATTADEFEEQVEKKKPKDTTGDEEETGAPPAQVPFLGGVSAPDGVLLQWTAAGGASSYLIFKGGVQIAEVQTTAHLDPNVSLGSSYSYAVAAQNKWGLGPHSPSYVHTHAPVYWQKGPAAYTLVSLGGDAGSASETALTEIALLGGCARQGAVVEKVRPAEGASLDATTQTFTLHVAYNLAETTTYHLSLYETEGQAYALIDWDEVLPAGCGTATVSYTVDLRYVAARDLYLEFRAPSLVKRFHYSRYPGAITLEATRPAAGTTLSSGLIEFDLAHAGIAPGRVEAQVIGGDTNREILLGRTAAAVTAATGALTLQVPFEIPCGFTYALLRVGYQGGARTQTFERIYLLDATTSTAPVLAQSSFRARYGEIPEETAVLANWCDAAPLPMTIATSTGLRVSMAGGPPQAAVTGTTTAGFELSFTSDELQMLSYGTHAMAVTVTRGTTTYALPVTLDIFDYFFSAPLPVSGVAGIPYAVAATAVNVPLDDVMLAAEHAQDYGRYAVPLTWQGYEFKGALEFPHCGFHDYVLADTRLEFIGASITEGGPYAVNDDGIHHVIAAGTGWSTLGAALNERCGRAFTWEVVAAPAWLRFETLTGEGNDFMFTTVFRDELPEPGVTERGLVVLETSLPGVTVLVPITARAD